MKISIDTPAYNERRYGKPWIAKVDFSESAQGAFAWGEFIGSHGEAGLLEVSAEPGDIIATGQRDNRKMRNSAPEWHYLSASGELIKLEGKAAALKKFRENLPA